MLIFSSMWWNNQSRFRFHREYRLSVWLPVKQWLYLETGCSGELSSCNHFRTVSGLHYIIMKLYYSNYQFLQLEQHENCIYDFLEFRDGDREDSPLIGRFCGYSLPKNIKSSSNKMWVKFSSDTSVEKAGFSFEFIKGRTVIINLELVMQFIIRAIFRAWWMCNQNSWLPTQVHQHSGQL